MKQYVLIGLIAMLSAMFGAWVYEQISPKEKPIFYTVEKNNPPTRSVYYNGRETNALDFSYAAAKATPAVVHIRVVKSPNFKGQQKANAEELTGSGVIISSDGLIVTNKHLVDRAKLIEITLFNKKSIVARVVGSDVSTDIALLKIEAEETLPKVTLGNSDNLKVGEWVMAVGNPFNLNSTVTAGIVSAKGRDLNITERSQAIESYIQSDAAVNEGSSGGALVNTSGELVGINTGIVTISGAFEGYSFAIPVKIVKSVIDDLQKFGSIRRAALGIDMRNLNAKDDVNLEDYNGVYIINLPTYSPAAKSGLRKSDIIKSVNGHAISDVAELYEVLSQYKNGQRAQVGYVRGDKMGYTTTTLGKVEDVEVEDEQEAVLGGKFRPASPELLKETFLDYGVQLIKCNIRGLFCQQTNMEEGFIITKINRQEVRTVQDLYKFIKNCRKGTPINVVGRYPGDRVDSKYSFSL